MFQTIRSRRIAVFVCAIIITVMAIYGVFVFSWHVYHSIDPSDLADTFIFVVVMAFGLLFAVFVWILVFMATLVTLYKLSH